MHFRECARKIWAIDQGKGKKYERPKAKNETEEFVNYMERNKLKQFLFLLKH